MTKNLSAITALLLCTHIVICEPGAIKLQLRIGATDFSELTRSSYVSLTPAHKNDFATQKFLADATQAVIPFKTVERDYKAVISSVIALPGILKLLADPLNQSQSVGAYTIAAISIAGFFIFQNIISTDGQYWFKSINNKTIHLKKQNNRWVIEYLKIT